VVRALDKRLERSRVQTWADPLSGNNLGQVVHTHVPLSPSSQEVMVPCGREGNRKSVYDEIENVIFFTGRKGGVLSEVERREKRQNLRGKMVSKIAQMNVKVAGEEFVRCGSRSQEERGHCGEDLTSLKPSFSANPSYRSLPFLFVNRKKQAKNNLTTD